MKNSSGFTLIETLIAIFTLGLIAAFTLPSLNSDFNEELIITKLKKYNTQLEIYYQKTLLKKGSPDIWHTKNIDGNIVLDFLFENVEISKSCKKNSRCLSRQNYYSLDGIKIGQIFSSSENNGCALLTDGSFICIRALKNNCKTIIGSTPNVCGEIFLDLNGMSAPNALGKDTFVFYYTKTRIYPADGDLRIYCNKFYRGRLNGTACASWVLENNNMDYLTRRVY